MSWTKSLQSQRRTKLFLKNFPTLQKNKKRNAQPDRQMTRKLNTDNGLQRQTTEHQPVTAVWRNDGFSGKLKCSFSNQPLWWVDSEELRNPPLRKAAKRCPAMPPLRFGTAGQRGGDYISCCACAFANASALRTTRDLRKFWKFFFASLRNFQNFANLRPVGSNANRPVTQQNDRKLKNDFDD